MIVLPTNLTFEVLELDSWFHRYTTHASLMTYIHIMVKIVHYSKVM